jgi:ATP-dependent Lhr-like helicase
MSAGESGLLHATTGTGKTYAVWLGALLRADVAARVPDGGGRVLWVTPMRALAADTTRALAQALEALRPGWSVSARTSDTSSAERARQSRRLPEALVTTPESLTLLLTRADARAALSGVAAVVVDEWHELMGGKRGVQTQLALARLRTWNPGLVVWGLSATLGNLEQARDVLLGPGMPGRLVRGSLPKKLVVDTLVPGRMERFPWAGHLGLRLVDAVVREIDACGTTLVFTNTRAQAELWYRAILEARTDWAGLLALHHGSLDRELRDWVELGLKTGELKACVCTSSLDLGVDFLPVERVLQVGSPKGVARLLQRAGRSGHAPGQVSRVTCVPTHAFELVEAAAARQACAEGRIESRRAPEAPLDVLVQHLVSIGLGGGFHPAELLAEVRTTHAYRELTDAQWAWALDFAARGGGSLRAYPEYHKLETDQDGRHVVRDAGIARRHRMSVGTIVGNASMEVRWLSGGRIGHVEESFIGMLDRGDCFWFAGRTLELVRVHQMTALVRRAAPGRAAVPRWTGGKMPLSSELAEAVVSLVEQARDGHLEGPEMETLRPLFRIQAHWSHIPGRDELLVETLATREGFHFFCFPFAGRHVHTGLANLCAWRIARHRPASFSLSVNDYGFELLCADPVAWEAELARGLLSVEQLEADIVQSLNAGQLARSRFREIARIAGLVFQGHPGAGRSNRQLQASSELFFDVFQRHDSDNLLLRQAGREVLEQELEFSRLATTLGQLAARRLVLASPPRPTPMSFPLMVARIREKLSTEKLEDRVRRMLADLDRHADAILD